MYCPIAPSSRECRDFFELVRKNDIKSIEKSLKDGLNVNILNGLQQNAIQSGIYMLDLKVETCSALIFAGINLDHIDELGHTALLKLVYSYKSDQENFIQENSWNRNSKILNIFTCLVQGGADLNLNPIFPEEHPFVLRNNGIISIREKIRSFPEMEAIVQEVHNKRVEQVYRFIKGDINVSGLVCEMIDPTIKTKSEGFDLLKWLASLF